MGSLKSQLPPHRPVFAVWRAAAGIAQYVTAQVLVRPVSAVVTVTLAELWLPSNDFWKNFCRHFSKNSPTAWNGPLPSEKSSCYFAVWKWVRCVCLPMFVSPDVLIQAWNPPSEGDRGDPGAVYGSEELQPSSSSWQRPISTANWNAQASASVIHCGCLAGSGPGPVKVLLHVQWPRTSFYSCLYSQSRTYNCLHRANLLKIADWKK